MPARSDDPGAGGRIGYAELHEPFELRCTAYDQKRIAEVPAAQPSLERPIGSHPEGSVTRTCVRAETETGNSRELVHASFGDCLPRNEHRTDACTGIDPLAKERDKPGLAPGSDEPHPDRDEQRLHGEYEDPEDVAGGIGVRTDPNEQDQVDDTERNEGNEPDRQTEVLAPKAVERHGKDQGGERDAIDLHRSVLRRSAHISTRLVSSTSRAICADSSAGLANAISSRRRFTNATSTSSPYSSPE